MSRSIDQLILRMRFLAYDTYYPYNTLRLYIKILNVVNNKKRMLKDFLKKNWLGKNTGEAQKSKINQESIKNQESKINKHKITIINPITRSSLSQKLFIFQFPN